MTPVTRRRKVNEEEKERVKKAALKLGDSLKKWLKNPGDKKEEENEALEDEKRKEKEEQDGKLCEKLEKVNKTSLVRSLIEKEEKRLQNLKDKSDGTVIEAGKFSIMR